MFAEQLALAQQAGLVLHTSWGLTGLGLAAAYQDDEGRAAPLLRQGLRLAHDLGNRFTAAECLAGLAAVTEDPAGAARVWGAVERLHHDLGVTPPSTRALHQQQLATLEKTLGADALQAPWPTGRTRQPTS